MGQILKEHDDLDYLTLNLNLLRSQFVEAFLSLGWLTEDVINGDLELQKDSVKVHLGMVEVGKVAKWTHNAMKGSLLCPVSWLSLDPVEFGGMELHVIAPELQYVLKERPELLKPNWLIRDKDILEKEYLHGILLKKRMDIYSLHRFVVNILLTKQQENPCWRIIDRNRSW